MSLCSINNFIYKFLCMKYVFITCKYTFDNKIEIQNRNMLYKQLV